MKCCITLRTKKKPDKGMQFKSLECILEFPIKYIYKKRYLRHKYIKNTSNYIHRNHKEL